jgi:hypothetical protein
MVKKAKPAARSAMSNGSKFLANVDGRSLWARRCRDLYAAFVTDAGGADVVSEARSAIMRRAAVLACELERRESAFALAGGVDPAELDLFAKTSAVLSRLLEKVGLERTAKDITPTPAEFAAKWAAERVATPDASISAPVVREYTHLDAPLTAPQPPIGTVPAQEMRTPNKSTVAASVAATTHSEASAPVVRDLHASTVAPPPPLAPISSTVRSTAPETIAPPVPR